MDALLPVELWRMIFGFDPTYHERWELVRRELESMEIPSRCSVGGLHKMKAFDGLTDLTVTRLSDARLVTVSCRMCGFAICGLIKDEF